MYTSFLHLVNDGSLLAINVHLSLVGRVVA
jgi:hypothetical protein